MLGFKGFDTATITISGSERGEKIRKQQFLVNPRIVILDEATSYLEIRKRWSSRDSASSCRAGRPS
jgi:hypothetical protein